MAETSSIYDSDHRRVVDLFRTVEPDPSDSTVLTLAPPFSRDRIFKAALTFFQNPVLTVLLLSFFDLDRRTLPVQDTFGEPGSDTCLNIFLPGSDRLLVNRDFGFPALLLLLLTRGFPSVRVLGMEKSDGF